MSAFCVPTPCIIAIRSCVLHDSKNIDTKTKIKLVCDTELPDIEVYYTIDGTKPQPYVGIVQGSKTLKYTKPFCLPVGKITVRAVSIHAHHHTMCSSIISKFFCIEDAERTPRKIKADFPVSYKSTFVKSGVDSQCCDSENILTVEVCNAAAENVGAIQDNRAALSVGNSVEVFKQKTQCNLESEIDTNKEEDNLQILQILPSDADYLANRPTIEEVPNIEANGNPMVPNLIMPSEISLQHCTFCDKVNSMLSRYCNGCGGKLYKNCRSCKEHNPGFAHFCQFCGRKFSCDFDSQQPDIEKKCRSVGISVKPVTSNRSTLSSDKSVAEKSVQTFAVEHKNVKKVEVPKKLPSSSAGRGFWRQQVDYICNHFKAHANNNDKFQKLVATPPLGQFLSANASVEDGCMSVVLRFETLSTQASMQEKPTD